jgi:O-antigen ligase
MVGDPVLPGWSSLTALATRLTWAAAFAAAAALGVVDALIAYHVGPMAAALLPVAGVVAYLVIQRPIVGACLAALSIPLEGFTVGVGAAGLSPSELMLLLTAGAVVVRLPIGHPLRPLAPVHIAFGFIVISLITGILVAQDTTIVAKTTVMWTCMLIVSAHIATRAPRDIEQVLICVGIAAGLLGLLAIAGGGEITVLRGGAAAQGRATGGFTQPNLLGFFLTLAVAPTLVLAGRGASWRKTLMLGVAVAAIAGLVLSLSRSSIVGCGLSILLLMAWPAFRRLSMVGFAVLLVVAAFNFSSIEQSTGATVVGERLGTLTNARERSSDPRFDIWAVAPEVASDHPLLGVGYGNFSVVSPSYGLLDAGGRPYAHAHNVPLTIAAEGGLVGLLAMLGMLVAVAGAASTALRRRASEHWPLALGICGALGGLAVVGMGDYPFGNNAITATALFEIGALVALGRRMRSETAAQELNPA